MLGRTAYVTAFLVLALLLSAKVGFGQVIFTETMGTVGGTTTIAAHETANGFDNDAYTMTQGGAASAGDLRATTVSTGYTGASGGANVFITTTAAASRGFAIEGIDASAATSLTLTFGFLRINATNNMTVEYWDGSAYQNTGAVLTGGTTNVWQLITVALPAGANIAGLRIRFIKGNDATTSYRIDDVKLTNGAATPTVNSVPTSLTNFSTPQGTPSAAQSISVSGSNLTANLTVGALAGYEFSTTGAGGPYSTAQVSLAPSGGVVSATTVHVRLTGATAGTFNGPLPVASTGATTVNVTFNGSVTSGGAVTVTPASLTKFIAVAASASDDQKLVVSGAGLTDDIVVGPLTGYEFSLTSGGSYSPSLTLTQSGGNVPLTDVFMRLSAQPVGNYNGTLNITSTGSTGATRTITGQAFKALSSFTAGNIVVARVGETSTPLAASAAPYFLIEYTKAGVKVDSGLVPVTVNGGNSRFTTIGNSTTSGLLNLSPDHKYLIVAGTSAPVGTPIASANVSSTYPKVVGRINYLGGMNSTTNFNNAFMNNNMRAATTLLGDKFWASGTGDINTGGVFFGNLGATAGTAIVTGASGNVNNTRYIQISNSQLYISTGSGTQGIYKVGTGLPESATTFTSAIPTNNPEGFYFVDADPAVPGNDLCYVARDGGAGNQGVAKFRYNGTSWTAAGVLDGTNLFGIYAEMNGTSADLYFTTATQVYKYSDANAQSSTLSGTVGANATLMVVAPTNTNFHGISLTPENVLTAAVDLNFASPGPTSVAQGTADKAIYRTQMDVTTATATFTGVTFTTSGSYTGTDVENFKLWYSADNVLDGGDILLATDATVTGNGESLAFTGLGQAVPVGTSYLLVSASISGCASITSSVGITQTSLLNFGFGSANVTGTEAAGTNYSITAGTPSAVTNLVLTRGQQNLPIAWDALSCSDNYLVVVHTAPISGTPSGTYTGNLNYTVAPAFTGGGKVVYTGTGNSITVTGLTVGQLYYVKVWNHVGSQYSTAVGDSATSKNTTFYSQADGDLGDPIWALAPFGTPATIASLGGLANNKNVVIQTGHDVTYNASGSITCLNLTVNTGASLKTVNPAQSYMNINGNILNNGTIGGPVGGGNAEFTSINLQGLNQTWSGNGSNILSRIRKNGGVEAVTNFTVNSNVQVTFNGTAVYNSSATSKLNITVNAGKTLSLTDPAGVLSLDGQAGNDAGQIAGSLTVNGSLYAGLALLLQNNNTTATYGTSLTIGSAGYVRTNNFTADMTGGQGMTMSIAAGGQLVIRGTMTVASGTVSTNGIKFEYNATTNTPGRLSTLGGGANVTGVVTVEQKVPVAAGWHLMCAPVKGATFSQWSELTPRLTPKNNASLFDYTEGDTTRGEYNGYLVEYGGWKIVNSLSDPMNPGDVIKGYRVFGRAPFITTDGKVSVTGQPFTGNVVRALTKTATGWEGGGWNLIGNPYASEIDWDNVIASNGSLGIDQAIYIWNGTTKAYGSYVGGTPSGGVTDKIPMSQGFFVYVSGAPGSLTFSETHKSATGASVLREAAANDELRLHLSNGTGAVDEAVIKFVNGSTLGFDLGRDSRKMNGPVQNISSMPMTSLNLQINTMPELVGTQTLKLKVQVAEPGNYTLAFTGMETFAPGTRLYLKDNYLGSLTNMNTAGSYSFAVSQVPASSGDSRFELVASATGATGVVKNAGKPTFSLYPNPAQNGKAFVAVTGLKGTATATIIGVDGAIKATLELNCNETETVKALPSNLKKGVYSVRIASRNYSSTQKLVVE